MRALTKSNHDLFVSVFFFLHVHARVGEGGLELVTSVS
jgi:hypothetical protein